MADYKEIAKIFEDRIDQVEYYETRATTKLKNELFFILENETKQLIFLIGEPGCGKSIFLHRLPSFLGDRLKVIGFNTPFFEPVDFVKTLIQKAGGEVEDFALEKLISQAVSIYSKTPTLVTIDEAQLLDRQMVELLRILADSKAFWFVLAMHRHESKNILSQPQFSSRPHRVLELEGLEMDEVYEYISKELVRAGLYSMQENFSKKLAKDIHKIARGNFRDTKKILNRLFLLLDYAIRHDKRGYQKPNRCLVTMAAIDGGLIDV